MTKKDQMMWLTIAAVAAIWYFSRKAIAAPRLITATELIAAQDAEFSA